MSADPTKIFVTSHFLEHALQLSPTFILQYDIPGDTPSPSCITPTSDGYTSRLEITLRLPCPETKSLPIHETEKR